MTYDNFDDAYAAWIEHGGAMNYIAAMSGECRATWEVVDGEELADRIECTPKEATEDALAAGGLTREEIAEQMIEWID